MGIGYSSGMRNKRVVIMNRKKAQTSDYGIDAAGIEWEECGPVWAAVDNAKGMRALNAGAVDAYSVVLVRMNYNCIITMRSRIKYNGQVYQILPETFHPDWDNNTIQFNAQAIVSE